MDQYNNTALSGDALIRRLHPYISLSQSESEEVSRLAHADVKVFAPRIEIVRPEERPVTSLLILEGWACRYRLLPDGRKQIIGLCLPGDMCEPAGLLLGRTDHGVASLTAVRAAEIHLLDFRRLHESFPRLSDALLWQTAVMLSVQREWTVSAGRRTAHERVAHLLCELYVRLQASGSASEHRYAFPLTQNEMADTLGLSVVHVNRILQEFRREKLISLRAHEMRILNWPGLRKAGLFSEGYLHLDSALRLAS